MKIRTGFVSNSSTSSFCIYGAYISRGDVKEELTEDVYTEAENLGLSCYVGDSSDDYAIGLEMSQMEDDETKAQFRERIKAMLQQLVVENTPLQIAFIEDEYGC